MKLKHLLFAAIFFVAGVFCGYVLSDLDAKEIKKAEWWSERGLSGGHPSEK